MNVLTEWKYPISVAPQDVDAGVKVEGKDAAVWGADWAAATVTGATLDANSAGTWWVEETNDVNGAWTVVPDSVVTFPAHPKLDIYQVTAIRITPKRSAYLRIVVEAAGAVEGGGMKHVTGLFQIGPWAMQPVSSGANVIIDPKV